MNQYITFVFIFWCHHIDFLVLGQRACSQDRSVLNSCDGRIVTYNNLYIDFGVIKSQCSCTVEPINNAQSFYILSKNPGNDNCGTGIQIRQSNNVINILRCSKGSQGSVFTNLSSVVMFFSDNGPLSGDEEYCLQIFTKNAENYVTGFCGTFTNTTTLTKKIASYSTRKVTYETDIATNVPVKMTTYQTTRPSTQRSFLTSDGNVLSLQISLAIFVVISVILSVMTVYLFAKSKLRNKSMNKKKTKTPETDTNNYTELRLENMAAEPANQYESLTSP